MKTDPVYLLAEQPLEIRASLIAINQDQKGFFLVFDRSVFYPQGGGQASDRGKIAFDSGESFDVHHAITFENQIRHYVMGDVNDLPLGTSVFMSVDKELRSLNTRCHSAGHLLSHVFESLNPQTKAVKGHHFPGECYIEFIKGIDISPDLIKLNEAIAENIRNDLKSETRFVDSSQIKSLDLPYSVPEDKALRVHEITTFKPIPCGGTHVRSLLELGSVNVSKIKVKGGTIKVSYSLTT